MVRYNSVAVLMGGPSEEREVSLRSGNAVAEGLRVAGYRVVEVDVTGYELEMGNDVDAVFVALHGQFGEDGGIQTILGERGIPYAGSGPAASLAAFDKEISKRVFAENNIQSPAYEMLAEGQERTIPLPVVCKPPCQGSSIGVHRVFDESSWGAALSDVLRYGPKALVETYIEGRELTVGIVGDEALPVVEIVAPGNWYDYKAKYDKGESEYLAPAPVDCSIGERCQSIARDVFRVLDGSGFGRVDFRMSPGGGLYVLELNTIPGFTETSLLPKAAAAAGMTFSSLCDRIIRMASIG